MSASSPICLTSAEILQLTGKRRPSAQIRALRFMAIDHMRRPDGSIMVLRATLGRPRDDGATSGDFGKKTQPNWS
jgi:hypothetical protein